ncbi:MAG: DUF4920 domain-containing protein [Sandaracinaceae bacterium]|nr:DUF4920 domain-containing protein [Sandaracinaceae bacterium]MDW8245904.1 DUF4920 domain-containing protein [Sandaracinaceae bacterium]
MRVLGLCGCAFWCVVALFGCDEVRHEKKAGEATALANREAVHTDHAQGGEEGKGHSCSHHKEHAQAHEVAQVTPEGRFFGKPFEQGTPQVKLADIARSPRDFEGKLIRTEGRIERVCKAMGCWMEIKSEDVGPVQVPMAGHSFFLPRDVEGREAVVEGRVYMASLSEEERRHLEAEGAKALDVPFGIEATGVLVR